MVALLVSGGAALLLRRRQLPLEAIREKKERKRRQKYESKRARAMGADMNEVCQPDTYPGPPASGARPPSAHVRSMKPVHALRGTVQRVLCRKFESAPRPFFGST